MKRPTGTYARLYGAWRRHRKVRHLSNNAAGVYARLLSDCADNLTDGHVSRAMLREVPPGGRKRGMDELVHAGLLDVVEGGWEIHGYLDVNPSRREVEAMRSKDAERKRESRRQERLPWLEPSEPVRADSARLTETET